MAVELADLDLGAGLGVRHVQPGERDVLLQNGRFHAGGDAADLRAPLRVSDDEGQLDAAIREAIARKPKGHDFVIDRRRRSPAVGRHMSVTGG